MKRPKLLNVLALGFFLSMASIASVNTAEASGTVDLGPQYSVKYFNVQYLTFANITQLESGGTPTSVTVGIASTDGQTLDGIALWTIGEYHELHGWYQEVTVPYDPDLVPLLFENGQLRGIRTQWWFNY